MMERNIEYEAMESYEKGYNQLGQLHQPLRGLVRRHRLISTQTPASVWTCQTIAGFASGSSSLYKEYYGSDNGRSDIKVSFLLGMLI